MWIWWYLGLAAGVALLGFALGLAVGQAVRDVQRVQERRSAAGRSDRPRDQVWAAYGGWWSGHHYQARDVALFATRAEATRWARTHGLYVAPVRLGHALAPRLEAAARAPVVPWDDEPP